MINYGVIPEPAFLRFADSDMLEPAVATQKAWPCRIEYSPKLSEDDTVIIDEHESSFSPGAQAIPNRLLMEDVVILRCGWLEAGFLNLLGNSPHVEGAPGHHDPIRMKKLCLDLFQQMLIPPGEEVFPELFR